MNSDLAANGDVVFVRPTNFGYDLVRYRQGVFEPLAVGAFNPGAARTDGTVVVYTARSGQGEACRVRTPDGDYVVAEDPSGFSFDLQAQEGWAACRVAFAPSGLQIGRAVPPARVSRSRPRQARGSTP